MVTICQMSKVNYTEYDEVWAIVRSLKYGNQRLRHVPELSPSWTLFRTYLKFREEGRWNEDTFRKYYVPQFLKEMRGKKQQDLLNYLFNTDKRICLVCFCSEEDLCHRSIIGGMLQGAGLEVKGLSRDYSYYFDWWKNGVPGAGDITDLSGSADSLTVYNSNVRYLYNMSAADRENLFDSSIPTVCATGRRPKDLCMYEKTKYNGFVSDLTNLLYENFYVKADVRRYISGGAQGFDQMFFWAVERMKKTYGLTDIQNVVFVPFEHQESRWAKTGCFSQEEYLTMVRHADMVIVVCDNDDISSLFERNHAMCDYSDYCLGLYPDDNWRISKGGTAECLQYAIHHCNVVRLGYAIDDSGLHIGAMHCKSVQV